MWIKIAKGKTIGKLGSENGIIILDEEYADSCRITVEKTNRSYDYAITCGVYGSMCHTVFVNEDKLMPIYEAIKKDLQEFIDKETTETEEIAFYNEFTTKY
jgi:hypothetical protein